MTSDVHRLSFGRVAEHYDRVRPTYPAEALVWALGDAPKRVVDLGAGTGLLTRVVLGLGHDVIPVEPDPEMRARLEAVTPGIVAFAGSAEEIPLEDGSVDAVIAGQAYHWFDRDKAHPEIARVLKPGGVIAPMWNERQTDVAWMEQLDGVISPPQGRQTEERARDFGPLFTAAEHATFRHVVRVTQQKVCDLVASRSYYIMGSPEMQADIMRQVRELVADLGVEFDMPYSTNVDRAFKL